MTKTRVVDKTGSSPRLGVITHPEQLIWMNGPLPAAEQMQPDEVSVLAFMINPDQTWDIASVYLPTDTEGRPYWARVGRVPIERERVRWYAIVRYRPYAELTPVELAELHQLVRLQP